jgi:hypothetical protein
MLGILRKKVFQDLHLDVVDEEVLDSTTLFILCHT